MATKDYVRKNPNKKNAKTAKKRTPAKKQSPSKPFPWKLSLVTLLVLAGFVWALISLNSDPEPTKTETSDPVIVAEPVKVDDNEKKVIDAALSKPEETWDYVTTLPTSEVEVTAKEQVVPKVPYIMQCGAYKSLKQANERKAKIAFQGLSSKVVREKGSSWYRIILGTYKFQRDALKVQHQLQRVKIEPCIIMKDRLR